MRKFSPSFSSQLDGEWLSTYCICQCEKYTVFLLCTPIRPWMFRLQHKPSLRWHFGVWLIRSDLSLSDYNLIYFTEIFSSRCLFHSCYWLEFSFRVLWLKEFQCLRSSGGRVQKRHFGNTYQMICIIAKWHLMFVFIHVDFLFLHRINILWNRVNLCE